MRNRNLNELMASAEVTGHLSYGVENYRINAYREDLSDLFEESTLTDYRLNFARGGAIDAKYGIYDDLTIHDAINLGGKTVSVDNEVDLVTKARLFFADDKKDVEIIGKYISDNELEVHHKYVTQGQMDDAFNSGESGDYDAIRKLGNNRLNLDLATEEGHLLRQDFHNGDYSNVQYSDYEEGLEAMKTDGESSQYLKEETIENNNSYLIHALFYAFGDVIKNRSVEMSGIRRTGSIAYAGAKGMAVYFAADTIEDVLSDSLDIGILDTLFDDSIGNILVGKGLIDVGEAFLIGDTVKAKERLGSTVRKSSIRYGADFAVREIFGTQLMSSLVMDLNLTWLDPTYVTTAILMSMSLLKVGYKSVDNMMLSKEIELINHGAYYDAAEQDLLDGK